MTSNSTNNALNNPPQPKHKPRRASTHVKGEGRPLTLEQAGRIDPDSLGPTFILHPAWEKDKGPGWNANGTSQIPPYAISQCYICKVWTSLRGYAKVQGEMVIVCVCRDHGGQIDMQVIIN